MRPAFVLSISLSVLLTVAAQAQAHPPDSARIVEGYGKLPLAFEANQGQSDPQVKFLSRGAGYSLFLTADAAVLSLQPSVPSPLSAGRGKTSHTQSARAVLRMKLVNTNSKTEVSGQDELPGKSNYFIGNDPKKWHTNVQQFSKVRYKSSRRLCRDHRHPQPRTRFRSNPPRCYENDRWSFSPNTWHTPGRDRSPVLCADRTPQLRIPLRPCS